MGEFYLKKVHSKIYATNAHENAHGSRPNIIVYWKIIERCVGYVFCELQLVRVSKILKFRVYYLQNDHQDEGEKNLKNRLFN